LEVWFCQVDLDALVPGRSSRIDEEMAQLKSKLSCVKTK
jgi:hypothetical protein